MKRHSSDRHIQRQLEHHQTPVNAEELWAAIEPAVQPQKRSRRWLFAWLFFAVVGFILVCYFATENNTNKLSVKDNTVAASTLDQSALGPDHSNTIQDQPSKLESPSDPNSASPGTKVSITPVAEKSNLSDNNTINNTKNNQPNISFKKAPSSVTSKEIVSPAANANKSNSVFADLKTPTANPLSPYLSNDLKASLHQKKEVSENDQLVTINDQNALQRLNSFGPLKTLDYSLLASPLPRIKAPQQSFDFAPSSTDGFTPWSVNLRVGIGSTIQDLSTKSDSFLPYQAQRNQSEEQLENLSLEVGLQWTSKQHWYLRSGLGYRQTVDRFSLSNRNTESFTDPEGIVKVTISPDGRRDTTFGTVTGIRTIIFEKTTYNRHRFLEIPIIAGYNFGDGPFSFGVEAGVVPQFLFSVKGEILDTRNSFIDLESVSETKLAWSLHGAFNINYDLDAAWQVTLSPVFRYQFSNLHQADYPLKVSYHSLGAQLGIRYAW